MAGYLLKNRCASCNITDMQARELLKNHLATLKGKGPKARFSEATGITPSALSRILAGRCVATLPQAVRISDATAGAVPVRAWVDDGVHLEWVATTDDRVDHAEPWGPGSKNPPSIDDEDDIRAADKALADIRAGGKVHTLEEVEAEIEQNQPSVNTTAQKKTSLGALLGMAKPKGAK